MADEKLVVELPSNADLFNTAVAPEPAEPAKEPAEPTAPPAPVVEPPPPAPAPQTPEPLEAGIPSWRLREEAEARRQAEDRARQLGERLQMIEAHLRQQQPAAQPDFFANPAAATEALLSTRLQQTLEPLVQEVVRQREYNHQAQLYMGKMLAEGVHGSDVVSKAEEAFLKAREAQTLDPADYETVVGSPNRYDAVVRWHRRQSVLSAVGDDPSAWFERELATRMNDPKFQAEVLEKVRGSAAGRPSVTQIPPSLSRATASAGNSGEGAPDMSDRGLFDFALTAKR